MIRFVTMEGIYADDTKAFGFYNTVTESFISLSGSYVFDSIKDFEETRHDEFDRMKSLIPQEWYDENKISAVNPIVDICGETIDLRKVERVGKIGGDTSWLTYSVYFVGGDKMEIYHERKYADNIKLRQMQREKFVELWQSFINYESSKKQ